jgi:hypothetical protein
MDKDLWYRTTHPTALSPFHGHYKMRSRAFDKSLQRSDKLLILNQLVFLPFGKRPVWPAPGSEDTELGVLMELEVGHGETEVYAGVQA